MYARGLQKSYVVGFSPIPVLKNIDISVATGEFVAIMGVSGSGKSTLMYILGCLDHPDAGNYFFDGIDVLKACDNDLAHIRANHIGFVFQTFNLLDELNVYENVELPFHYCNLESKQVKARVIRSIEEVHLGHRINHKPSELSGGEMQRAAIARALAIEPKLILADEPTGNLDSESSNEILRLFKQIHHKGSTIILVTHNHKVAVQAQRIKKMKDGIFV